MSQNTIAKSACALKATTSCLYHSYVIWWAEGALVPGTAGSLRPPPLTRRLGERGPSACAARQGAAGARRPERARRAARTALALRRVTAAPLRAAHARGRRPQEMQGGRDAANGALPADAD